MRQFRNVKPQLVHQTGKHVDGRKIVAVDFDGTIVRNRYPYIENPNIPLIEFIKTNRDKYTWILWTCRNGKQLDYAIEYMESEHDIVFDFVNCNVPQIIEKYGGDTRKLFADYYIDDRNVDLKFFKNEVE